MTSTGAAARTENPGFSVVVPMYNRGELACRTIGTVYGQIHPPAEVIVVDDGSTDGAGELVRRRYPEVTVIRQENAGEAAARNTGMAHASSDWVAFVDADDLWLPHHLAELAATITEHPDAGWVASRLVEHRHGGTFLEGRRGVRARRARRGRRRSTDYFLDTLRGDRLVTSSTVALHREVPQACGGFAERDLGLDLGTDRDYWARIAARFPLAVSDTATAAYVRGVGGDMEAGRRATPGTPPDLAAAKAALEDPATVAPRRSIQRFIDHLVLVPAVERIVAGEQEEAVRLLAELERPRAGWAPVVRALAAAPPWLVGVLRRAYRLGRGGATE